LRTAPVPSGLKSSSVPESSMGCVRGIAAPSGSTAASIILAANCTSDFIISHRRPLFHSSVKSCGSVCKLRRYKALFLSRCARPIYHFTYYIIFHIVVKYLSNCEIMQGLSKVERDLTQPPSADTTVRLAKNLALDPDVLLAVAGKVSGDLLAVIRRRPALFGELLRELKDMPDHAVLRLVREVRDGEW
jgi:hypothetical protein